MGLAGGDLAAVVEAIQATHHQEAAIHGGRGRRRLPVELIADVVDETSFVEFRQGQRQRR